MAKLVCQSGPTAGHEYPLTKDLIVMGRQSTCDVQIMDTMSSRAHCQIRRDGKLFSLVDLGSRNGTALNGKRVSERQLAFGDRLKVGESEYLFVKEPGDIELKDLLSKYEIQEKIGEGGMGIVYKANQRSMARVVALKILSPKYAARPKFVDQFIKEARAAGALNHPNIIQVHDVGTENDIHYFSMEFIDGATCMQILRQSGPFLVRDALEVARRVAKALEYAHEHRLIHQDIKPDNIMVSATNQVKLADLGISKTFDEVASEDGPRKVMGTPHYMAPEAALGKKIDHRVDIYALGATLYHLLTGKTPYNGTSATDVLKAHVMDPFPAIQDLNPAVSDDVCALVERMTAKKPEDRYQSASDVVEEIHRLETGSGLGQERIAGSETMILRRYSQGKAAISGTGMDTAAATTGNRTPGVGTSSHHALVRRHGPARLISRVLTLAIIALVIGVAGMVLWPLARERFAARPDAPAISSPSAPVVGTGSPVTPAAPPADQPPAPVASDGPGASPGDGDQAAQRAIADEIDAIDGRLRAQGDRADADEARRALAALAERGPDEANRQRLKTAGERVEAILATRRGQSVIAAFGDLETDVGRLAGERNFDLALARIDAFEGKSEGVVASRWQALRERTAKAKADYLRDLGERVAVAVASRSIPRLRDLRDQLPQAMLNTPAEQDIVKAIKAIEDDQARQHQQVIDLAAKDLGKWNFAAVEDRHRSERAAMGASPAGRRFDEYLDAARKLTALIAALDARFTARALRYQGTLVTIRDPDLVGAGPRGLMLDPGGGAKLEAPWTRIPAAELEVIIAQALKDEGAAYRPALAVIAQLGPGEGTK